MPWEGAAEVDMAVLLAVTDATHGHQQLRSDYRPAGPVDTAGEPRPRRVEPHHVLHRAGRWYMLTWDLERTEWRTFRIDRLRP